MITHRNLAIVLLFVSAILGLGGLLAVATPEHSLATLEPAPQMVMLAPESLTARAAVIYDPREERMLFEKNGSESLPLASLTKLMAAQAVLDALPQELTVVIAPEHLRPEGDSGLRVGEEWALRDLLLYGLVASSNDAMAAAVGTLGQGAIESMNASAARLGMTQTYFLNPTGLDLSVEVSGAYGSARDVAILTTAFLKKHPQYFEATAKENLVLQVGGRSISASSTAAPLLSTPGFIGAKTGYTDLAGGNLVVVFESSFGNPLVAVVLGSTREGRFEDMRTLIEASRQTL